MAEKFKKLEAVRSETFRRDFQIKPGDIDKEARTVKLSWGSEEPVDRFFGIEILDFSSASVRMGRLNGGAAFLLNHDSDQQVGAVQSADLKSKRGYAIVKISRSRDDIWNDILDGIRTLVSVGYRIYEAVTESVKNGVETVRVIDWEPYELSLVGVPADATVGIGRSASNKVNPTQENKNMTPEELAAAEAARTRSLPANPAPAPAPVPAPVIPVNEENARAAGAANERKRISEINALASRATLPDGMADEAIRDNWSADRFRQAVFEKAYPAAKPVNADASLDLTEKEKRSYSVVRAMNTLASKKPIDGFEKELSDEVAKRTRRESEGFFIPSDITGHRRSFNEREQRALSAEIAAAGGYTVQTDVLGDSMIELLRNKTLVNQLGALLLTGLVGDVAIPRQNGGAVAYWLGENDETPESDQAFGQIALRPRRLAALTGYTKQLLAQSSIGVELFVRSDLMKILAIAKDLAAINGTGANGQPLGILNTNGVGSVTFGGAPTWPQIVSFETKLGQANADRGNRAWLTTPGSKGNLKTILKATGAMVASSSFIWDANQMNGYPAEDTNQVPNDQVIFGNWNDLVMADWDGMDVVVDPYTLAAKNQIRIVLNLMTDIGLRHPASFVVSSDSGAQS